MPARLHYLLLQVRRADDPMRHHEVSAFATALHCPEDNLHVHDLLSSAPSMRDLDAVDAVLLGGSGDFSVAEGGPWLEPALDAMRELYDDRRPTFASCWGFQALALALGGEVVTDMKRAEVGTHDLTLTEAGRDDPIFGPLGSPFPAQLGHQDIVDRLPPGAVRLASSRRVENQAFMFPDRPMYCTQFHPELSRALLMDRLVSYPKYVESVVGRSFEAFVDTCRETPGTEQLLSRFARLVLGE
jgi:GMP synthase (glutamine-hydrolysing)